MVIVLVTFMWVYKRIAFSIEENKKVENAMQESEERYRQLFEMSPDAIFVHNEEHFIFVNPATVRLACARDAGDLIGKPVMDFVPPENREIILMQMQYVLETHNPSEIIESKLIRMDGSLIDIEVYGTFSSYDGKPAIQTVAHDVTKRKKEKEDLKEREEKYRNLVERANDGITIIQNGMVKYANPRHAEIMGYTVEELTDKPFFKYIHPDELPKVLENYNRRMAGEDVANVYETVVRQKDGNDINVEFNAGLIPYQGKNADFVFVRDITERKRVEKELVKSEERFRSLFENIHVAILEEDFSDVKTYIKTLVGKERIDDLETYLMQHPDVISRCSGLMKILDVNQATLELHEAGSKSELLENIEKTFTRESYVTFCKELVAILKGETQMETDTCMQTLSGMPKKVAVHWCVSPGHEETLSRVLVSFIDITERTRAENNLKKYSKELQHSNEMKDLFTDIMHHDLLNPAGVIKGHTEMLLDLEEDEKKRHSLKAIERNNEKLVTIIEKASTFAKLESIDELEFETMDIGIIIKGVIENFRHGIEEKRMTIDFAGTGTYPSKVNPVIEEVFANLLSNAKKYSPEGNKIIVDILDAGDKWKVTVTDFGEGIADEDKTGLFERFRRADRVGVKGTGLGLAIVKRLITLHGGSVGVGDNPEARGSVFWVTLKKAL